jgi:hypothetical protein
MVTLPFYLSTLSQTNFYFYPATNGSLLVGISEALASLEYPETEASSVHKLADPEAKLTTLISS